MDEFADFNLNNSTALEFIRRINKIKFEKPTTKSRFSEQTFLSDFQDPLLEKLRERQVHAFVLVFCENNCSRSKSYERFQEILKCS